MHIYKTTNTITGKFYVGKEVGYKDYYFGSGKLLKQAIKKYGKQYFIKETLEHCVSVEHLNEREMYWIDKLNALGSQGYNMARGGTGGDLSKYINYKKRQYSIPNNERCKAAKEWLDNLAPEERIARFKRQGMARTKGWYVSRIDCPTEVYVQNIAKWCEENGVDKSMPSSLNNPKSRLYQKQTKGWRIRRSDIELLPPYENRRNIPKNNGCKGRHWKVVNGKRVWYDKY